MKLGLLLGVVFAASFSQAQLLPKKCSEEIVVHATDSVFDLHHPALADRVWTNPGEIPGNNIDDDKNGYVDDIHGWNAVDQNGDMGMNIDTSWCDHNCKRYMTYRFKKRSLKANAQELAWLEKMQTEDSSLVDRASHFIDVFHGTSTISVALEQTECVKWMGWRDMGNKALAYEATPGPAPAPPVVGVRPSDEQIKALSESVVQRYFDRFIMAKEQIKTAKARVSGHAYYFDDRSFSARFDYDLREKYQFAMDEKELTEIGLKIYQEFKRRSQLMITENPNTLFVFPTNNAAENVDLFDYFPMNLNYPNTLVVQASDGLTGLAPFTGYGVETTDLAVPSVGVYFAVPGGSWMWGAATSLSVPVAMNAAVRMLEINPKLTAIELKEMLVKSAQVNPVFAKANKNSAVLDLNAALKAAEASQLPTLR